MLTRPNFQRLLKVADATENCIPDGFSMQSVWCGTAGCMIGNYNIATGRMHQPFGSAFSDESHFGITLEEYLWLFDGDGEEGYALKTFWLAWVGSLKNVTKEQALSRLRKFIYYKMHKAEMLYDDNGIREEARRKEGNHNFAQRALELVQ